MMKKGVFISMEGGEGAGKSSLITLIKEKYFEAKGFAVITTREPGGIEIAEQIRSIILNKNNVQMDGRTEALLYAAARRQHLVEKIIPALERGQVVLCDRFIDSSLAYQGYARGLGMDEVLAINSFAIDKVMPDLTLFFDIRPEIGLARISANKDREVNRLDLENISFHHKVREGYLELVGRFPERIVAIDAEQSIDQVFEDVIKILDGRLFI